MFLLATLAFASPAYDQLKLRDPVPCSGLGEATPALRDELLALASPAILPSVVPMRAADCLAHLFAADLNVQAAFLTWMTDPGRAGQALLILGRADTLPEPVLVGLLAGARQSSSVRVKERAEAMVAARAAVPVPAPAP